MKRIFQKQFGNLLVTVHRPNQHGDTAISVKVKGIRSVFTFNVKQGGIFQDYYSDSADSSFKKNVLPIIQFLSGKRIQKWIFRLMASWCDSDRFYLIKGVHQYGYHLMIDGRRSNNFLDYNDAVKYRERIRKDYPEMTILSFTNGHQYPWGE